MEFIPLITSRHLCTAILRKKIQYSFPKVSRSWTKDAKSLFSPGVLGKISDYFQTFLFMKAHLQSQQQLCTIEA